MLFFSLIQHQYFLQLELFSQGSNTGRLENHCGNLDNFLGVTKSLLRDWHQLGEPLEEQEDFVNHWSVRWMSSKMSLDSGIH